MALSLRVLGEFAVRDEAGRELSLPTRKTRALLAYLAVHAGQPQLRERLMVLLWGDREDRQARQSLNQALRSIRRLGDELGVTLLDGDLEHITLNDDVLESDVTRFRELLADKPAEAVNLYAGPFLDGLSIPDAAFEEWLTAVRAELQAAVCNGLRRAAEAAVEANNSGQAIELTQRLVSIDPVNEDAHRRLMLYLYDSGDRVSALRQFQTCADFLKDELQVEPDAETKAVYEIISEGKTRPAANIQTQAVPEVAIGAKVSTDGITKDRRRIRTVSAIAAIGLVVVAATMLWSLQSENSRNPIGAIKNQKEQRDLSLIVLPFDNFSDDPKQDYFADAITEDVITDLSRMRGSFVIARGTSFTFKGKAVNTQKVATDLNVKYVIEGSVRRTGDMIRVNVQLIDGANGAHIWSDRFDKKYQDVFALQNEITGRIASTLNVSLLEARSRQLSNGPPASLQAWDYALQGNVALHEIGTKSLGKAKSLFEKALQLDPNLAFAWSGLARLHYRAYRRQVPGVWSPNSHNLSLEAAQKAILLDPRSSSAYTALGFAYRSVHQLDRAVAACETAVELNPNNGDAYLCLGTAVMHSGKPRAALGLFEKALLLNPRYRPNRPYMYMGQAYALLEQYEDAVHAFNKSVSHFPNHTTVLRGLGSALAKLGRMDEARAVVSKYIRLSRGKRDTIEKLRTYFPTFSDLKFERLYGGLHKAGMPQK